MAGAAARQKLNHSFVFKFPHFFNVIEAFFCPGGLNRFPRCYGFGDMLCIIHESLYGVQFIVTQH